MKTETMTRSLTDLSTLVHQRAFRSQDLEGQATVKPFLMFVFESVSGGNDCTRGVDPDGLEREGQGRGGVHAHLRVHVHAPESARRGERRRGKLRKEVQESRCRGRPRWLLFSDRGATLLSVQLK